MHFTLYIGLAIQAVSALSTSFSQGESFFLPDSASPLVAPSREAHRIGPTNIAPSPVEHLQRKRDQRKREAIDRIKRSLEMPFPPMNIDDSFFITNASQFCAKQTHRGGSESLYPPYEGWGHSEYTQGYPSFSMYPQPHDRFSQIPAELVSPSINQAQALERMPQTGKRVAEIPSIPAKRRNARQSGGKLMKALELSDTFHLWSENVSWEGCQSILVGGGSPIFSSHSDLLSLQIPMPKHNKYAVILFNHYFLQKSFQAIESFINGDPRNSGIQFLKTFNGFLQYVFPCIKDCTVCVFPTNIKLEQVLKSSHTLILNYQTPERTCSLALTDSVSLHRVIPGSDGFQRCITLEDNCHCESLRAELNALVSESRPLLIPFMYLFISQLNLTDTVVSVQKSTLCSQNRSDPLFKVPHIQEMESVTLYSEFQFVNQPWLKLLHTRKSIKENFRMRNASRIAVINLKLSDDKGVLLMRSDAVFQKLWTHLLHSSNNENCFANLQNYLITFLQRIIGTSVCVTLNKSKDIKEAQDVFAIHLKEGLCLSIPGMHSSWICSGFGCAGALSLEINNICKSVDKFNWVELDRLPLETSLIVYSRGGGF